MSELRYLPASDALLRDWTGPVERAIFGGEWRYSAWDDEGPIRPGVRVRLDTHRPEVIALLARWLAEGERCWSCDGHGGIPDRAPARCVDCRGTGYLRKPAPVAHLLPKYLGGTLDTERAGEALAWSWRSVCAGGEVLWGVLGARRPVSYAPEVMGRPLLAPTSRRPSTVAWWHDEPIWLCVDDDARSLAAGFAIETTDGVTWPSLPGESR